MYNIKKRFMKSNHLSLLRRAGLFPAVAAGVLLVSSCAQDGFDDESWHSDVADSRLESPAAEDITIEASADGSQTVISWPVVHGAGGYQCSVMDVTDADEPVAVSNMQDSIVDRCQIVVARVEDHNYTFSIKTVGNRELGNSDAEETTTVTFDSYLPAYATIPSGTDIYEYFQSNPLPEDQDDIIVYNLAVGGNYTVSNVVDLGDRNVMLRAAGENATIAFADGACFTFGNGFKLQNVNIDFTGNTADALLLLSGTPSAAQSTEALGYKAKGGSQDGYVMTNPVQLKNVNVKNLQKSLVYGNKQNWTLLNLIIDNCIVQLDNGDNSKGVIALDGASNGLIQNLNITNSTFFNLKENNSAYFLRYSNSSNSDPGKVLGTGASSTLSISHCTFANTYTGKDFGNNIRNANNMNIVLTDNIFYDVFRIYQFVQTNAVRTTTNNYIWWVNTSKQSNDTSRTDSNGNPICTEADPGFPVIEDLQPLDFGALNCGADFTPTGVPADNKAGDPRWLQVN